MWSGTGSVSYLLSGRGPPGCDRSNGSAVESMRLAFCGLSALWRSTAEVSPFGLSSGSMSCLDEVQPQGDKGRSNPRRLDTVPNWTTITQAQIQVVFISLLYGCQKQKQNGRYYTNNSRDPAVNIKAGLHCEFMDSVWGRSHRTSAQGR